MLAIVILIMIPLLLGMFVETQRGVERYKHVASFQAERLAEKILVDWVPVLDERYPGFWVNNTGTVAVELRTLFLIDTASHKILYAVNLTEYTPWVEGGPIVSIVLFPEVRRHLGGRLVLNPGEAAFFHLDGSKSELRRVTVSAVILSGRGVLHPTGGAGFDRRLIPPLSETGRATTAVMLEPRIVFLNFTRLQDLLSPESPIELASRGYFSRVNPTVGVVVYDSGGGQYAYVVVEERSNHNVNIELRAPTPFTAVIGRAPGSQDRYNILLTYRTGAGTPVNPYVWHRVRIEGLTVSSFSFQYSSSDGYVNVNTQNIEEALGFWYYANTEGILAQPGARLSITGSIRIVGVAEKYVVYRLQATSSGQVMSSYEPFVFVADTDGNGYGEVIIITEDYVWGTVNPPDVKCSVDEGGSILAYSAFISGGRITYNPWHPLGGFTFRLKGVVLDPRKVIGVYVMARVYYHDTELGGIGDCVITPYPILRFLLVDDNWNVLAFKDVTYNELVALASENTWPPNRQYVFVSATLAVPVTDAQRLYVAVSLIDPFRGVGRDDLDLTLGVEIIGVIPYVRGD